MTLLTCDEERDLIRRAQAGDTVARDRLILCNMGLVVTIAIKYLRPDMELPDLIQEGVIGLMRAIERFDLTQPWKFSTYAWKWANQRMRRFIDRWEFVAIPEATLGKAKRRAKAGGTATLTDWAALAGVKVSRFGETFDAPATRREPPDADEIDRLRTAIAALPPDAAYVIQQRFLTDDKTFTQIGRELGQTRERVRQIQNETLYRLRRALEDGGGKR